MIDSIEGVAQNKPMKQSSGTEASSHPRPNSLPTDTVEISYEAKEAIHIDTESNTMLQSNDHI
jgi:hypothetical protein